ncbi:hypothetical protein Sste5346_004557 [Sporothrix stenoceras]|uniref:CID domain-containing protein n=1 Tax=Sporothrix stenoceras TaxID=5173 RepID=A0ABR3Z7G1_9PEZI
MAATATQLAIAKASLTAVLLRPDATHAPWSRADIDEFAGVLALTAARCSPANVQTSKQWMLRHIVHSPARISAVGRYLVALANSFDQAPSTKSDKKETSVRRKRLHLLYIINDVLYHVTFRDKKDGDNSTRPLFVANIEPSLLPLVSSAASFVRAPKQLAKLNDLLDLWGYQHYVADDVFKQLRAAVEEGPRLAEEKQKQKQAKEDKKDKKDQKEASTSSKEAPFLLPALHGDPAAPWYDLPAATWLAVLEPNSTRPMNPDALKPIQLAPGPAPPALEASVRALLADVDRMFEGGEAPAIPDVDSDVNALGENIDIDVLTGDTIGGDTYYGWSRAFCQSMKERRRRWKQGISGRPDASPNRDRGRARSRQNDSRSMSMWS